MVCFPPDFFHSSVDIFFRSESSNTICLVVFNKNRSMLLSRFGFLLLGVAGFCRLTINCNVRVHRVNHTLLSNSYTPLHSSFHQVTHG